MLNCRGVVDRVNVLDVRRPGDKPLASVSIEGVGFLADTAAFPQLPVVGQVVDAQAKSTIKRVDGKNVGQLLWLVSFV